MLVYLLGGYLALSYVVGMYLLIDAHNNPADKHPGAGSDSARA